MLAHMKRTALALFGLLLFNSANPTWAQSLGNAGTIEGTVTDPSGAAVPKAQVTLRNSVSGYNQTVESGPDGSFRLSNIPRNPYSLEITASGFAVFSRNVDINNA